MRRLLVRRFESSFGSFKQSIENFLKIYKKAQEFIERTGYYVLDRKFIEESFNLDDDEILEELERRVKILKADVNIEKEKRNLGREYYIYDINTFKEKDKFLKDIESDIKLFKKILKEIDELGLVENDPKVEKLIKLIEETLSENKKGEPKRKIIIFSEFRDTVKYLKPKLEAKFRVLAVDGHLSSSKIEEINKNFDASYRYQEDKYDVLLTTDKISEGFNLARAGMIINYDIPWNPVRVIQRVGRINRIGQKIFDKLYIVNFFPTEKGESLTKQREIAENKLFLIHNSIGEDSKIFSPDEEPTPSELYQRLTKNPDETEEESFFTKAIKEYQDIKEKDPELISEINKLPYRIKVSKKGKEDELILLIKKGKNLFVNYRNYSDKKSETVSFEEIYEKIKADENEKPLNKSEKFWEIYEELKNYKNNELYRTTSNDPEEKARRMLKTLLQKPEIQNNEELQTFVRNLIKDIEDYGTIPVFTLKEISNLKIDKVDEYINYLKNLKDELGGENFIENYANKLKKQEKEILIAIENRIIDLNL
jgi:superfamily II DNA/RNA helicase